MWLTTYGEAKEQAVLAQVWIDVEAVAESYVADLHAVCRVGHEHFGPTEAKMMGSCEQKSHKSYELLLRPASPGALYRTALHEIGHAVGLEHTRRGVMVPASRQRNIPLTIERRRRWLRDFGIQLLKQSLTDRVK